MKNDIPVVLIKHVSLLFILLLSGFTYTDLFAQRGNDHIAIGAEAGPVITDSFFGYKYHAGLPFKVYYGTGYHGQWMLRSGIHHLWVPSQDLIGDTRRVTAYAVPFALGYRRNLSNWYAEGSVGVTYEKGGSDVGDPVLLSLSYSQYPANFGLELGYQLKHFDFGLSLQNNLVRNSGDFSYTMLVGFKTMYKIGF